MKNRARSPSRRMLRASCSARNILLRAYRADGSELWKKPIPGAAWDVNISGDGKLVVAAYRTALSAGTGSPTGRNCSRCSCTRRTGACRLDAEGLLCGLPGAEDLIGWHVNRDWDHAPDFFPASRFRDQFYRPDIVSACSTTSTRTSHRRGQQARGRKTGGGNYQAHAAGDHFALPNRGREHLRPHAHCRLFGALPFGASVERCASPHRRPPRPGGGVETKGFVVESTQEPHSSLSVEVPDHDFELSLIAEAEGALPSTPVRVRLKWAGRPAAQTIKPKMYALLIGVSHYEDKSVRALKWADKDAEDVKRILESQKGRLYRDVEARLIENEEATAARIVDELSWIESAASQGDRVIVFISGHGLVDERNSYFFVPYNARLERRGVLSVPARSTSVSHAQILDSLKRAQGHVLFFLIPAMLEALPWEGRRGAIRPISRSSMNCAMRATGCLCSRVPRARN